MKSFAHLHCHTEYSLLDGAARIEKLIEVAANLQMPAVAMTDHGNMYGAFAFNDEITKFNKIIDAFNSNLTEGSQPKEKIKGIFGCEFYVAQNLYEKNDNGQRAHLILLAKNEEGYKNLCILNSISYIDGFYYKPRIDYDVLEKHREGLICLSACLAGDIPQLILQRRYDEAEKLALRLKSMFGDDFYLEIQNHGIVEQLEVLKVLGEMSAKLDIKLVATNDVHYIYKEDSVTQDVLLCIQTGKFLDDPNRMKFETNEFYVKSYEEMLQAFVGYEQAVRNTIEIVDKCEQIKLKHKNLIPSFVAPDGQDNYQYLRKLAYEGLESKYKVITPEIKERAEKELSLINSMGFVEYFLIVWDFIYYAHSIDMYIGPGRGSGAGSIIAYALDITRVEPLKYSLLFERFINPERISMPDFDIDFPDDRRGEIIEYVTQKYTSEKVCQILAMGKMAAKAAVKDVARVFRVPFADVNKITKEINIKNIISKTKLKFVFGLADPNKVFSKEEEQKQYANDLEHKSPDLIKMYNEDDQIKKVVDIAVKLENMPRNCSQHAAGVVICKEVLSENIPLQRNGENITTQFGSVEVEKLGFLKMDFLGLRTLTDIKHTLDYIKKEYGRDINFYEMDMDDPKVYELISSGDTEAVFQLESGGFKKFMKMLKPDRLEDIITGVSLYRPGPMDFIPQYIKNKNNPKDIVYQAAALEPVLKDTYGVIVYQEQVMRIVQDMAGYTLGRADLVRKMMSKKDKEAMAFERNFFINGNVEKNIDGCVKRGVTKEIADSIFSQMETFGSYAFNKSHAAAYACVTYQTAWLKTYYPVEYIISVINNRISNIDDLKIYLLYCKEKNIKVLSPNINKSKTYFSKEDDSIRFGLCAIKGAGIQIVDSIVNEREQNGEFKDLNDFISRTIQFGINKRLIENLIYAGAMDCFDKKRSQLIYVYENIVERVVHDKKQANTGQVSMFDTILKEENALVNVEYPNISEYDESLKLKQEKEVSGIYLSGHPLDKYISQISAYSFNSELLKKYSSHEEGEEEPQEVLNIDEEEDNDDTIYDNMPVEFIGIISGVKKIITKNAKEMAILTVDDLYGSVDVMIFNYYYIKYKPLIEIDKICKIKGKLSIRQGDTPIIICENIEFLDKIGEKENSHTNVAEKEMKMVQDLWLLFDTTDLLQKDKIEKILHNYPGKSEVKIVCSQCNDKFKMQDVLVDINNNLLSELYSLLGINNVVVK